MYKLKIIKIQIVRPSDSRQLIEDLDRKSFSKEELEQMILNIPEVTFTNL